MENMNLRNRWVLVTGASSGLGEEMARQLATRHGANLVLVARREAPMQALAKSLSDTAGVSCKVIAADLSREDEVQRVFAEATAGQDVYGVVLNAGITWFGEHLELSWEQCQTLMATNVSSVVQLSNLFLPYLRDKGQGGGVMLVASMAGLLPVPYQSLYSGSKAFITHFGLGVAEELAGSGVSMTVFCPGGIATPMTHNSDLRYFENTAFLQEVGDCAHEGLQAMIKRRNLWVPGVLNRSQLFMSRLAPRKLITLITRTAYRKALDAAAQSPKP
jgi:short-subunit dehydrogenase